MEQTFKRFILISFLSAATAAPSGSSPDSPALVKDTTTSSPCPDTNNCEDCFVNNTTTCIFVIYKETSQGCYSSDFQPPNDGIPPSVVSRLDQCSDGGDTPVTTLPPHPETTTTNTSTSTSTPTTPSTTNTTTTISTTTSNNTTITT